VLTAITIVFIHNISVDIPIELMLTLTTGYAIIFFHILRYKTCAQSYKKLALQKSSYIGVLISLGLLWIGSFVISAYFSPSVYILFATAWSGFLGSYYLGVLEHKRLYVYKAVALALLIVFSYTMLFFYDSFSSTRFIIMIALTTITGISMFLYFKFSHYLNDLGLDAVDILMVRFWGIFIFALGYTIYTKAWSTISLKITLYTLLLAIISIVPVYFSQKSVEAIGSNKTSMLITSTPFITFVLEMLFTNNPVTVTGYLSILFIIISLSTYAVQRNYSS
jgi:drug/metabolite transporter (DMT)-like permease